jgi:hypothetical protein
VAEPEENIEVTMKVPCSIGGLDRPRWASTIRDITIAACFAAALIVWSLSFQVSEDTIEECKSACASTPTTNIYMAEVSATKCVCASIPFPQKSGQ